MEQSLTRLRRLWNFLRIICAALAEATLLLILITIPNEWLMPSAPIFVLGIVAAILALAEWKIIWVWVALLAQASLFSLGLFAAVFALTTAEFVPILLLAFTMILVSEQTLTTTLSYSGQFSNRGNLVVLGFNAEALMVSLNHLYKRLARDSLILGAGFVFSLAAASLGAFEPTAPILSDPSLYMVIASISLAALVLLKEK